MSPEAQYQKQRQQMIEAIDWEFSDTQTCTGLAHPSDAVREAMASVPRHKFVPTNVRHQAYDNRPLPIGYQQTISQPFIVALMTELLDPQPQHRVLEIGTGSGYQAAVLSKLVEWVYSIEAVVELAERASRDLATLGYSNITVKAGNGREGWPEFAPFDSIIITAGGALPPTLLAQLKAGGRLVMPLEDSRRAQSLTVFRKLASGELSKNAVLPVRFVPLVGDVQR